ncbi:MAG: hypothetical protein IJF56_10685 [Clostridia bacterium]|nr:hypothetical protein [Clostridia bacterium]
MSRRKLPRSGKSTIPADALRLTGRHLLGSLPYLLLIGLLLLIRCAWHIVFFSEPIDKILSVVCVVWAFYRLAHRFYRFVEQLTEAESPADT